MDIKPKWKYENNQDRELTIVLGILVLAIMFITTVALVLSNDNRTNELSNKVTSLKKEVSEIKESNEALKQDVETLTEGYNELTNK